MDISEANDDLKPGGKYFYPDKDQFQRHFPMAQLGRPLQDGIVVHYRGTDIISIEVNTPITPEDALAWKITGHPSVQTIEQAIEIIDKRLDAEGAKP